MRLRWWIVPAAVAGMLLASYALAKTIRFPTQTTVVAGRFVAPGAESRTVEFTVRGLKCWTMSNLFTDRLKEVDGVIEIRTFVRTRTARITYDPSRTSPEALTAHIDRPVHNPETGETFSVFEVESRAE